MTADPTVLVVDASVGVKLFLPEEGSEATQHLFRASADDPKRLSLVVPDLFYAECANVLWKAVRRGFRTGEQVRDDVADLVSLGLTSLSAATLAPEALHVALACGVSAYDGSYVAAAAHSDCTLVTADERLAAAIPADVARIVLLRDAATTLGL